MYIGYSIGRVYQDSRLLAHSASKGNRKFEILFVKIFSLKQKTNLTTSSYYRKCFFCSSRKQYMVLLDKRIQWVNVKQKPLRQIQAKSGISRNYSGIFKHIQKLVNSGIESWYMQNPDISNRSIFRTRTFSQPWYIQNSGIFRALAYSKSEAYFSKYLR